jgi:hypothetical protein
MNNDEGRDRKDRSNTEVGQKLSTGGSAPIIGSNHRAPDQEHSVCKRCHKRRRGIRQTSYQHRNENRAVIPTNNKTEERRKHYCGPAARQSTGQTLHHISVVKEPRYRHHRRHSASSSAHCREEKA